MWFGIRGYFLGGVLIWIFSLFFYGCVPTNTTTASSREAAKNHTPGSPALEGGGLIFATVELDGASPISINAPKRDWAASRVEAGASGSTITINPAVHDGTSSSFPILQLARSPDNVPHMDIEKYVVSLSCIRQVKTSKYCPAKGLTRDPKRARIWGCNSTFDRRSCAESWSRNLPASTSNFAALSLASPAALLARDILPSLSLESLAATRSFAALNKSCASESFPVCDTTMRVATTTKTAAIAANANPHSISSFQKSTLWLKSLIRKVREPISSTLAPSDLWPLGIIVITGLSVLALAIHSTLSHIEAGRNAAAFRGVGDQEEVLISMGSHAIESDQTYF